MLVGVKSLRSAPVPSSREAMFVEARLLVPGEGIASSICGLKSISRYQRLPLLSYSLTESLFGNTENVIEYIPPPPKSHSYGSLLISDINNSDIKNMIRLFSIFSCQNAKL